MPPDTDFSLSYKTPIVLSDCPARWITSNIFQLFWHDLPQFPLVYVHFIENNIRTFGCVVDISFEYDGDTCTPTVTFLSNQDLSEVFLDRAKTEIEHRFGIAEKFGLEEVVDSCEHERHKEFFAALWPFVDKIYGNVIPFGRFYDEVYSIIRFSAAWAPKVGIVSEMRMLYWVNTMNGQKVDCKVTNYESLDFFLLPTYDEIREFKLDDFPIFLELIDCIQAFWNAEYTGKVSFPDSGLTFKASIRGWANGTTLQNKEMFIQNISMPLVESGKINEQQRYKMEKLIDAFNRHAGRTSFFVWSIMSIIDGMEPGFHEWEMKHFTEFYLKRKTTARTYLNNFPKGKGKTGVSEKVVACFLQQGFGNSQIIPIDTWVEAFHMGALGIETLEELFSSFNNLGKIERVIWLMTSKARKSNLVSAFDILWCVKKGLNGNKKDRLANPLSCYQCLLRESCPGFQNIRNQKVTCVDENALEFDDEGIITTNFDSEFVVSTIDKVPKKVFKINSNGKHQLADEFSGYLLSAEFGEVIEKGCTKIGEMLAKLPEFKGGFWQR
jgi:hypothetical protein